MLLKNPVECLMEVKWLDAQVREDKNILLNAVKYKSRHHKLEDGMFKRVMSFRDYPNMKHNGNYFNQASELDVLCGLLTTYEFSLTNPPIHPGNTIHMDEDNLSYSHSSIGKTFLTMLMIEGTAIVDRSNSGNYDNNNYYYVVYVQYSDKLSDNVEIEDSVLFPIARYERDLSGWTSVQSHPSTPDIAQELDNIIIHKSLTGMKQSRGIKSGTCDNMYFLTTKIVINTYRYVIKTL